MAKNIVIGIGNILFKDDGIGVFTALFLEKNYIFEPPLEILDGGTLGIGLLEYISQYDNIFLIDTISIKDEIGSIYVLPSHELLGMSNNKNTAHEVEVVDMLKTATLLDKKAKVTIFAIIPFDIKTVEIGLSKIIEDKFDILTDTVIDSIKKLGIKVTKKGNYKLKDIIKEKRC